MNMNAFLALLVLCCAALGQASKESESDLFTVKDPRWADEWPSEYYRDGESLSNARSIPSSNAILIVARMKHGERALSCDYEISGLDGRYTAKRVEAFLRAYYAQPKDGQRKEEASNVIIMGNDWGAGSEIFETLKELSKAHKFSVYARMTMFRKVQLMPEPAPRLAAIRRAFEASAKQ